MEKRTIGVLVCLPDHTWTTVDVETPLPRAELDEQTLIGLLPAGYAAENVIVSASLYYIPE
jgi:hypothetical protein